MSLRPSLGLAVVAIGFLPVAVPGVAGQEVDSTSCVILDRLGEATLGNPLPPGWSLRAVSGESSPSSEVVEMDGVPVIMLKTDAAAGQAWHELDQPIEPGDGELAWAWRVDEAPAGALLEEPAADDAPARLFVAFGGGGLLGRPRMLFYTWGRTEEAGRSFLSHVSDRVGVIVLRNETDPTGEWLEERRDVFADFRGVFNRNPDEIRAVGLMSDTDQTRASALAYLRELAWVPGPPGTKRCFQGSFSGPDQRRGADDRHT